MVDVYCEYRDCEHIEDGQCQASAMRIDPDRGCLTYQPMKGGPGSDSAQQGDQLTWDREFIDDNSFSEDIL